ncbi:hypothetical protein ACFVR2_19510 [Gottfriedia sp. NPDC057991]|uniref:hypothetical protein n=1 Tax=Gottfriedia sp. NPDC057991 TaxID=3346298 RepID=UPI0036D87495
MIRIKKALAISTVSSMLLICGTAFAANGKYSTTYSMTGGVESKRLDVGSNPSFTVAVNPTKGIWVDTKKTKQANIELQFKMDAFGLDPIIDVTNVPSVTGGNKIFTNKTKGKYYIYYRNYTGLQMEGKTSISWKY